MAVLHAQLQTALFDGANNRALFHRVKLTADSEIGSLMASVKVLVVRVRKFLFAQLSNPLVMAAKNVPMCGVMKDIEKRVANSLRVLYTASWLIDGHPTELVKANVELVNKLGYAQLLPLLNTVVRSVLLITIQLVSASNRALLPRVLSIVYSDPGLLDLVLARAVVQGRGRIVAK
jgi:hypothetical protein